MQTMEFEYDDSGQTFTYFILAALAIYLVPATLSRLRGKSKDEGEKSAVPEGDCHCEPCRIKRSKEEKDKPRFNFSFGDIFYVIALVLFLWLAYTSTSYTQEKLYDPFEVLGLDHSATEKEIKAEYRKLSKQWHPDKNIGNPEAQDMFVRIAKAYEALTNEQIRKNWEEYGNPDGPGLKRFGIALPSWIVEKGNEGFVLAIYALVFGLGLPISVAVWWRNSRKYIKDTIMEVTAKNYIIAINTATMPIKSLFKTMCLAEEFEVEMKVKDYDQKHLPTLLVKMDELPNDPSKMGFGQINLRKSSVKALVLYHAHMHRLEIPAEMQKDMEYCLKMVPVFIQGLVEGAAMHQIMQPPKNFNSLTNVMHAMHMSQMLIQAMDSQLFHYPLLQIPHITNDHLRHLASKKNNIKTVEEFYKADLDVLKKDVLRMEDKEFEDVLRYGSTFPFLRVKCTLSVHDAELEEDAAGVKVSEGDVVTCTVYLRRLTLDELKAEADEADDGKEKKSIKAEGEQVKARTKSIEDEPADADKSIDSEDEFEDENWEELQKDVKKPKLSDVKKAESVPVHCPYYPFPKQEQWWVLMGDKSNGQDRLFSVPPQKVVTLKTEEKVEIRFQAPSPQGKYHWTIFVLSDSYIGADVSIPLKLSVGKAVDLPKLKHEEEEEEEELPALEDAGSSGDESDF